MSDGFTPGVIAVIGFFFSYYSNFFYVYCPNYKLNGGFIGVLSNAFLFINSPISLGIMSNYCRISKMLTSMFLNSSTNSRLFLASSSLILGMKSSSS